MSGELEKKEENNEENNARKIQSLREMINSAERTIQSAKAMLLQLEGKKKTGRKRKASTEEGHVVEGTFDGQIMIGADGKQYPVPANYASKSKLVEGDMLKLIITSDGSFIYKQIGPVERKNIIGIISQDENGNYYVVAEGKPYRVLLASVTYFKAEPGDEVVALVPKKIESSWAAIENILKKIREEKTNKIDYSFDTNEKSKTWKNDRNFSEDLLSESAKKSNSDSIADEWTSDIELLEQEIKKSDIS